MRYEVLDKRERLNEEFWRAAEQMCQLRRRMQRLKADDSELPADRTISGMLREMTALSTRQISGSRKQSFPEDEVAHCSLPAMNDEVTGFIDEIAVELERLRAFSQHLIALEQDMRDHRLTDWVKYPPPQTDDERRADIEGINRLRLARDSGRKRR